MTGSVYRPTPCGICYGCGRHGKNVERMLTPAHELIVPLPGKGTPHWYCKNKTACGPQPEQA